MLNTKYLAFGTPDGDALRAFLSKVLKMLNAKCYFLAFLAHQMIKTHLHQICKILKFLALSYSRISFLTPYCSKMLEFLIFFFSLSLSFPLFSLSLSLSLSLSHSFTLLPLLHYHYQHL